MNCKGNQKTLLQQRRKAKTHEYWTAFCKYCLTKKARIQAKASCRRIKASWTGQQKEMQEMQLNICIFFHDFVYLCANYELANNHYIYRQPTKKGHTRQRAAIHAKTIPSPDVNQKPQKRKPATPQTYPDTPSNVNQKQTHVNISFCVAPTHHPLQLPQIQHLTPNPIPSPLIHLVLRPIVV